MNHSHKQHGVTLMELMATVAIIGILASIAYPSYRATVRKANRSEARIALTNAAGDLERCFTRYMKYNDTTNCTIANLINAGTVPNTTNGYFSVAGSLTSATAFTVTATAIGPQASDLDCYTFTLDQTGAKTAKKKDNTANDAACWR